jgi:flagellar hook-associated protein 2
MALAVGGLVTGLDTDALVARLLAVERRPVTLLEARKVRLEAAATAFGELGRRLGALQAAAAALDDAETVFDRRVTSSAESVATAVAGAGTGQGSYALTVTALARGSVAAAAAALDAVTDPVASGAGVFEFRLGAAGPLVSVAVDGATTLESLVAAVNAKNAGVRAAAVNTGTAQAPAWTLTLVSTGTGSAQNIVIVTDQTTLGVTTTQTAQDAQFTLAGFGTFTRPANTVSDALEGVTLTLKALGDATLVLEHDRTATQARVQALLDAYNEVVRYLDGQMLARAGADGTVTPGAFTGDVVPRQLRHGLASAVAARGGDQGTLAELGLTTSKDGTLGLDGARFQAALAADPQRVSAILAGSGAAEGIADVLLDQVADATRSLTGTLAVRQDGLSRNIRMVQQQIDTALGRLETSERLLRRRFATLEETIARIQNSGSALLARLASLEAGRSRSA